MQNILIEEREIPGHEKQKYIFNVFDELAAGYSMTIVCHYDPAHIKNQFDEHRPSQCEVEYLTKGPVDWKMKLTKLAKQEKGQLP